MKWINRALVWMLFVAPIISACLPSPGVNIIMNSETIRFNLKFFEEYGEEGVNYTLKDGKIIYRSHYSPELGVSLSPDKEVIISSVGELGTDVNLREAVKVEMEWLTKNRIIEGLSEFDIEDIVECSKSAVLIKWGVGTRDIVIEKCRWWNVVDANCYRGLLSEKICEKCGPPVFEGELPPGKMIVYEERNILDDILNEYGEHMPILAVITLIIGVLLLYFFEMRR